MSDGFRAVRVKKAWFVYGTKIRENTPGFITIILDFEDANKCYAERKKRA